MPDKKEIIEYLRNRQKAAEIEAKINGINLWVLLGAIAVVSWQLIESVQSDIWMRNDLILRVLLCSAAAYILSSISSPTPGIRDDVRYSSWRSSDMESPFLVSIQGLLLLLPAGLFFIIVGKSLSAGYIGFFGAALVGISAASIVSQLVSKREVAERFPKLQFSLTRRSDITTEVIIGFGLVAVIADQVIAVRSQVNSMSVSNLKTLALLAALYLLALIAVHRKQMSHRILWTYELETDLLLDAVSPDVALRRIEHRALGPRLQDVMDRFFDDLDKRFAELDSLMTKCHEQLDSVPGIPPQYQAERAARIETASELPKSHIDELLKECDEFTRYLKRLGELKSDARRPAIAALLPSLAARHAAYEERAKAAKSGLNEIITKASSEQQ